jgi:photosystem II stability/assembly factor-like uncharacterized protein
VLEGKYKKMALEGFTHCIQKRKHMCFSIIFLGGAVMQKFLQLVMVFIVALTATSGAASQDLLEADPSIVHTENPVKMGMAAPGAANDDTWTSGGPVGSGSVTCLAIAPSNPNVMYAGSEGSIYRTSDGGATWTSVGVIYSYIGDTPSTSSATILDLQVAHDNPDLVYAGTETGINISQNGGRDWTNTWPGSWVVVNSIAVDPSNPKNILIGTGHPIYQLSDEIIGIFKSTDGGLTWQEKLPRGPFGEALHAVHTILFDTNNPKTVYAGTEKYDNPAGYDGGLRKSIDSGETWSPLKVNSVDDVFALAMTPAGFSPATIYAYAYNFDKDIYASTDQGVTWVPLGNPDPAAGVPNVIRPFMVVDPGNPKQFYSSGPDSLYKYDSDTELWTEIAPGVFSIRPRSMVIHPINGDMFVGAYTGGFFQSSDGGSQWISSNLINTKINNLAVDPTDSQTAYAAVDGIGYSLAKTNNSGDAWDYLVNSETYLNAVAIDPQNPTTIYAAKDTQTLQYYGSVAFIYQSLNRGQDWYKIPYLECTIPPCEITITKILISAGDSDQILIGGTDDNGTLARTTDGGTSWDELDTNTTTAALAADPNDPDIVYGGGAALNLDFVFRFNDVWGDWTTTTLIGPENIGTVRDIAVDQGSRVYVAASDGLYRWEEGGDTTHFTNLPTDYIMAVTVDRSVSPNAVYIGTSGMGVYVSKDGGSSWKAMNDGLASLFITTLQVSEGQPKLLYAGTTNSGVWSTTIGNGEIISIPLYLPLLVKD